MAFQPQEFSSPLDIANRALQHLGVPRIASFADDSKQATETAACYDQLRVAELRRNVWRFATRRALLRPITPNFVPAAGVTSSPPPTLAIEPGFFDPGVVYFPGAVVVDTNFVWWQSLADNNLGNTPGASGDFRWERFFGPTTASAYDSTTAYSCGEHVYVQVNPYTIDVYTSLIDGNQANPTTARAWDATTAWMNGQIVQGSNGYFYMSLVDLNTGNDPTATPHTWEPAITYALQAIIIGSDGLLYQSLANSNTGNDPTTSPTWWIPTGGKALWTSSFVGSTGDPGWHRQQGMSTAGVNWLAPMQTDANGRGATRRVFRLPSGFLRQAATDPKGGQISWLGFPGNRTAEDYVFEGNFFTSGVAGPVMLRFVADITDVTTMDPMFCEGSAARMAMELCEVLTQSQGKFAQVARIYNTVMGEARLVNGIETGPVEPPLDDYLTCRM